MAVRIVRGHLILLIVLGSTSLACHPSGGGLRVTREGRLELGGAEATISDLDTDPAMPVTVCADEEASWMHVQWVLAALGAAGHKTVRLRVGDQAALDVPVFSGLWHEKLWNPEWPDPWLLESDCRAEAWRQARITVGAGDPPRYRLSSVQVPTDEPGEEMGPSIWRAGSLDSTEVAEVGRWARSLVRGMTPCERQRSEFVVEASGVVSCLTVLTLLRALQEADAGPVALGLEALHPFDCTLRALPAPPYPEPIVRWAPCREWRRPLLPVNLPIAPMALRDHAADPDDRVIVSLNSGGRIYMGEQERTLAGIGESLREAVAAYDRKRHGQGFEEVAPGVAPSSKLFLLLRADQDAPLHHLRWLIAEVRAARIYKLQLAVRREPSRDLTPGEADRAWAGREIAPLGGLDHRICCFLSTEGDPPAKASFDLRAAAERGERVRSLVSALDRLAWEGIARVDLRGADRAHESIRHVPPLPPE